MPERPPTKRERAINTILADVLENGRPTGVSLRAYVEGPISRATYNDAVQRGLRMYQAKQMREGSDA